MPSRSTRCHTSLASIAMMLGLVVSIPSFAQELMLPSDPLAGRVIESTASPVQSTAGSRLSSAPMSADSSMMGTGPISANSSGSYYNPLLGSHIRARYTTQSYGQQAGTLDLGTMKLMPLEGGMAFVDGQVTLNDESHVGYNLGAGYRWMTLPLFPFSPDDRKIMGVSVWSDGGSKGGSNFFPQIGTSLEFLGDRIDFRANGYAPIGNRTQTRDFTPTTAEGFTENGIGLLLQGVEDTALTVGEAEVAGRIGDLDAWAFAGVYGMRGGIYEATGGKLGLRGYVTPDLFLSVAVANDDEFDTNTLVNLTWFIGRTRAENCPTGVLEDRLREPVLRNNYVASQERAVTRVGDVARSTDGSALRIIHIDSTAANGGNGTFESPFNSLDDITDASTLANDTILFHGGSDFNNQQAVLLDGQIAIGEGGNFVSTIDTFELGTINLPETAAGAQSGSRPTINGGAGVGIVLADGNTIQNLEFDGGVNAIANEANGSNGATLNNLSIANTTGDGISLTAFFGADADDIDGDGDTTEDLNVLGAVAISEVTFDSVGGNDIDIDASVGALATANIIAESISITGVTSDNNTTAESIAIRNTTSNGSVTISDFTYNGGATGQGGLLVEQTSGTVALSDSTFNGGATAAATFTEASGNIGVADITYNGGTTSTGGLVFDRTTGATSVATSTFNDGTGVAITATETSGNHSITDLTYDGGTTATGGISLDKTSGAITINTASFTNGAGVAVTASEAIGTIDIDNMDYEGGTTATGALLLSQTTDAVTVDTSTFNEGIGPAVQITQTEGPISIGATVDITNVDGKSVVIDGPAGTVPNTVAIGADISNTTIDGGGVVINANEAIVNFTGAITTRNDESVNITDSQANITFSGAIDDNGTGDAITITNAGSSTTNVSEVSFTGDITNDSGRSVVINNGDDGIQLSGNLTDNGEGVVITNRAAGSEVTFGAPNTDMTISSGTNNSLTLSGNDETSIVTILANLNIMTTSGTGIESDGGQIDASNADNSISTESGIALDITGGSSNTGLRFASVNAGTASPVATNALILQDFDGTTTINDGELNSVGNAVLLDNSSLVMDGVDVDSTANIIANAVFDDDVDHTLSLSNINANGGSVNVQSTGSGTGSLVMADATDVGLVTFDSTGGSDDSVVLNDVTTNNGFNYDVQNAGSLDVDMTDITAAGTITFTSDADGASTLDVNATGTNTNTFVGDFGFQATGTGSLAVNMDEITTTTGGGVTFNTSATGNSSFTLTDATIANGDFTYTTTGDGGLSATMTSVAENGAGAVGATSITASGTGAASLSMTGVNTGSTVLAEATGGGGLTLNMTSSGNAEDFTGIKFDQQSTGTALADLDNVTSTSGIDYDSASDIISSLTVEDGSYGGSIEFDETGDGDASVTLDNVTSGGGVTFNEAGDGNATLTMTTGDYSGGVLFNEAGAGVANATLTNVTSTGGVTYDTAGAGGGALAVSGGTFGGAIVANAANGTTGSFAASVTNSTAFTATPQIVFNGQNTGSVDYEVSSLAFSTGANNNAIDLTLGSNVTTADVSVTSNTGIETLDGSALSLSIGGGVVDFLLSANTFTNNSASDTAIINHSGTTLNATVTGNTFTNSGGGDEFDLTNPSGSTTNLSINTNGLVGAEYNLTNNSASALAFRVRGDDAASVNSNNNANINFNPADVNFTFENTLNVPTP